VKNFTLTFCPKIFPGFSNCILTLEKIPGKMSMLLLNLSLPRWATTGQWGGKLGKKLGEEAGEHLGGYVEEAGGQLAGATVMITPER